MQLIIHDGKFSREGFISAWEAAVNRVLTPAEKSAVGFLDVYVQTHQSAIVTAATSSVAPKVSSSEESLTVELRNCSRGHVQAPVRNHCDSPAGNILLVLVILVT